MENCLGPITVFRFLFHARVSMQCYAEMAQVDSAPTFEFASYLKSFILTLALEAPFYRWCLSQRSKKSVFGALVICNLATHPLVCFGFPALATVLHTPTYISLFISEIFAPVVEALLLILLMHVGPVRAFVLMFAANLFSWWAGSQLWAVLIS
jgi:hypothetical protein